MKKETLIAVILGIAAGIAIALVIIIKTKPIGTKTSDLILNQITPTIAIDTKQVEPLLIQSPDNLFTTTESTIEVKGTAAKNSLLIIQSAKDDQTLQLKNTTFTTEVNLAPGENIIKITAYLGKTVDTRTLTVYSIQND